MRIHGSCGEGLEVTGFDVGFRFVEEVVRVEMVVIRLGGDGGSASCCGGCTGFSDVFVGAFAGDCGG